MEASMVQLFQPSFSTENGDHWGPLWTKADALVIPYWGCNGMMLMTPVMVGRLSMADRKKNLEFQATQKRSEKHLNFCFQSNGILILVDVWIWITNPEISVSKHPFFWETSFFIWWILHPGEIETDVMPWADTPWRNIALTALFRVHGCYCQVSDLLQRIHSAGSWRAELRRILLTQTFKRFDLTNCNW